MSDVETAPAELLTLAEEYALPYLQRGRAAFDIPHTRRVVYHVQSIGASVDQDLSVLATAGWLHDTGYAGLFDGDSHIHSEIKDRKAQHMIIGARYAQDFVRQSAVRPFLDDRQADRVVHLVGVHDKVKELKDLDEIVLMEADTLGAIDIEHVPSTFDYDNASRYLDGLRKKRQPRFQTELGRQRLDELLQKYIAHLEAKR